MLKLFSICLLPLSLVAQLNSPYDEQNPVLSPDKTEMYFTKANHPLNVSGIRDKGDIWVTKKENGKWGVPTPVKGLVNNGGYNAVLGFSQDGQEMFLYGHYSANGDAAGSQGISVSKRNGSGWSLPSNETIPYFLNKVVGTGGSITPDKNIFVFSAEGRSHDSYGNEDIYVSFNRDGVWTEPLNLGETINTKNQELSPYYDYSTNALFFSSNKPGGYGSFDVYESRRLDDTWRNWSTPAGIEVNTDGREVYYRLMSDKCIYTSTHNSDGYGDIVEIYYPEVVMEVSPALPQTPNIPTTPPVNSKEEGISIFGRVTNAQNGQGVKANISFGPQSQQSAAVDSDGQYKVLLTDGVDYIATISAPGFITSEESIVVGNKSVRELEINFKLQPVAVGVSVNLKHVLFKQSSPELLSESYSELDMVVNFLREYPMVEIELAGHTDDAGKASLNLKLSRDRVNHVKYYLVEKGINSTRVKGVGYGETRPIASNKTDEGRKMNRRVEFKIIKK